MGERRYTIIILDLGTRWSLGRFTPGGRVPRTLWIRGWVAPIAGLDAVEQTKISCHCQASNPGRPARSPSLYRLSYPGCRAREGTNMKAVFV
jgi:hypothetical protein